MQSTLLPTSHFLVKNENIIKILVGIIMSSIDRVDYFDVLDNLTFNAETTDNYFVIGHNNNQFAYQMNIENKSVKEMTTEIINFLVSPSFPFHFNYYYTNPRQLKLNTLILINTDPNYFGSPYLKYKIVFYMNVSMESITKALVNKGKLYFTDRNARYYNKRHTKALEERPTISGDRITKFEKNVTQMMSDIKQIKTMLKRVDIETPNQSDNPTIVSKVTRAEPESDDYSSDDGVLHL